ncbi:hypothetical protein H5410_023457 [Solanum commersonii]|uniref:Uncharacterized protein n=1 Tax=Solanum commersonii TaxID=4109 RepID=A0A9J5ZJC0_SOLCO|nr:hypothetical protein H5410_023457 [Solanum commersonii]
MVCCILGRHFPHDAGCLEINSECVGIFGANTKKEMGNYKILAGLGSAILDSRNPCQYCLVSPQIKWQLLQIFEMVMVGTSFLEGTSMTENLIAILAYCNNMTSLLSLMQPWTTQMERNPPKMPLLLEAATLCWKNQHLFLCGPGKPFGGVKLHTK